VGVVTGEIPGRKGVHIRTQAVHAVSDGLAVKRAGAPEREVLEKMGTAPLTRTLIAASHIDKQRQRRRSSLGAFFINQTVAARRPLKSSLQKIPPVSAGYCNKPAPR
jgi:hypothetical protein